ncbi:MAG: uracil-DNA glycosylase [Rickettsiales bacterium]|nr:uracil-DNA glycosylase [Rickettsiales bacterium]OUV53817.1 MAG: hypothetical protein CBC87_03725 [Rickettsiales bacterium TMED127]|tara:strand:- start:8656 stop:8874 length:219 start_codon:yes stop_codon:yes gene_type:complete
MKKLNSQNCNNCKHLFISHNKKFPLGCRAFGFISKKQPYLEVYNTSGMKCALFSYKKKNDINNSKTNKGILA